MKSKNFAILPFKQRIIKDRYLVSNVVGAWDFLNQEEFRIFNSYNFERDTPLFKRLYETGLVADERNLGNLIADYRNLNNNLFYDTSLHIAVVTTSCNLRCTYCQTSSAGVSNMNIEVASRVLKSIFDTKSPSIVLEFQGGEPLLNWETIVFLVENARKYNTTGKDLCFALVTNGTLLDEKKMRFCADADINICVSLDGPRNIHDKNRVFKNGKGSYDTIIKNITALGAKFNKKVKLMPTITKHSFPYFKEIVDEYVKRGQTNIALRPANKLGSACGYWLQVGYTPEEFIQFYKNTMEYILELNKKGIMIKERITSLILEKIINRYDAGYIELMSPCGAGRGQLVYMPDGSCYPCDEARMLGGDIFKLGNILEENYEDLMKKENLLHLLESSVMNLWDDNSVFSPWLGTCPVINYSLQENFVPKVWCLPFHKIYNFQFNYIFEKMLESKGNLEIFKSWVKKGGEQ